MSSTTSAAGSRAIAEELADLAIVRLRESIDAGGHELPVDEKRLTRARRAVEKAVNLLAEPDDTDFAIRRVTPDQARFCVEMVVPATDFYAETGVTLS